MQRPEAPAGPVRSAPGVLLAGILLASLVEAVASTSLSIGRSDIIGDIYATPDQFAWLDVAYVSSKLAGFAAAPWLLTRVEPQKALVGATFAMGLGCSAAGALVQLEALVFFRAVQGLAGAVVLVSAQSILFWTFSEKRQPIVQAVFAMGAVVAPATLAPALLGWLIDYHSWRWIFLGLGPVALGATGLLLMCDMRIARPMGRRPLDAVGLIALTVALFGAAYVLSQGSRWDWFEESKIRWLVMLTGVAFAAFCLRQRSASFPLLDLSVFRVNDFAFAFVVSFVAGAALFGSAFLIPAFAVSVLGFTPTDAGLLLLPSSLVFVGVLFASAKLMEAGRIAPIATVPFGIVTTMAAMWMLSGSSLESGAGEMMPAMLVRGFGLGCLFLSITLIAFKGLAPATLAFGIGIFNIGRQLGGLMGVAGLQTIIDHQVRQNQLVLSAALTSGVPAVAERLEATASLLVARGMETLAASKAAMVLLSRAVTGQATVIAFDTAFNTLALLFVAAVPLIVAVKLGLSRRDALAPVKDGAHG